MRRRVGFPWLVSEKSCPADSWKYGLAAICKEMNAKVWGHNKTSERDLGGGIKRVKWKANNKTLKNVCILWIVKITVPSEGNWESVVKVIDEVEGNISARKMRREDNFKKGVLNNDVNWSEMSLFISVVSLRSWPETNVLSQEKRPGVSALWSQLCRKHT